MNLLTSWTKPTIYQLDVSKTTDLKPLDGSDAQSKTT